MAGTQHHLQKYAPKATAHGSGLRDRRVAIWGKGWCVRRQTVSTSSATSVALGPTDFNQHDTTLPTSMFPLRGRYHVGKRVSDAFFRGDDGRRSAAAARENANRAATIFAVDNYGPRTLKALPIVKAIFVLLALALAFIGTTATVTTIQTAQEQAITQ